MGRERGMLADANDDHNAPPAGNEAGPALADATDTRRQTRSTTLTASMIAVSIASEPSVELFHDPNGEPWATVPVDGRSETYRVHSREFSDWLRLRCFRELGTVPQLNVIRGAVDTVGVEARYNGPEHPVYVRLA
jgi:hypothetical protein